MELRSLIKKILALAWPIMLTQLGIMSMQLVDLLILGHLMPLTIGPVGTASAVFGLFIVFGLGLLSGLDTLLSQEQGINQQEKKRAILIQGIFLATFFSILGITAMYLIGPALFAFFQPDQTFLSQSTDYLYWMAPSLLPALLFQVSKQYLQVQRQTTFFVVVIIAANLLNALLDYYFILLMGVPGAALATLLCRLLMGLALLLKVMEGRPRQWISTYGFAIQKQFFYPLLRLGLPAAFQHFLEVTMFSAASLMASSLGVLKSSAHQIALNVACTTFMIPMALAATAAIFIGESIGQHNPERARTVGRLILLINGLIMGSLGLILYLWPQTIASFFTNSLELQQVVVAPLMIAALFQLVDGYQVVLFGFLRGVGKVFIGSAINILGYALIGLPLCYYLCFKAGYGLEGLWLGLAAGLGSVAMMLGIYWYLIDLTKLKKVLNGN